MDDPVVVSLVVSGIGMLALFVALALLYGLMYLLTLFIRDRPAGQSTRQQTNQPASQLIDQPTDQLKRAAMVGVALARAELEMSDIGSLDVAGTASGWRALHRQRQLMLNTPVGIRTRTRMRRDR
jgi:hypothetical protein